MALTKVGHIPSPQRRFLDYARRDRPVVIEKIRRWTKPPRNQLMLYTGHSNMTWCIIMLGPIYRVLTGMWFNLANQLDTVVNPTTMIEFCHKVELESLGVVHAKRRDLFVYVRKINGSAIRVITTDLNAYSLHRQTYVLHLP